MAKRITHLISSYQDLRDRLGPEDPIVLELKLAIARSETGASGTPLVNRRCLKSGMWNRRSLAGVSAV
jgi:hypothetical protein